METQTEQTNETEGLTSIDKLRRYIENLNYRNENLNENKTISQLLKEAKKIEEQ